ncbi:cyclin-like protein [Hyaloraphidium curvatum]|nr:cyclin-like protein [Hyaloraphidium curvatum]
MLAHYSVLLRKFCSGKEIRFPDGVKVRLLLAQSRGSESHATQAAAMIYFWRFYLYESVMNYHPRDVLLTSALLASKTESFAMELKDILQIANPPDRSVITNLEFVLCQVLQFELQVRHPYLPMHGIFLDFQQAHDAVLQEAYATARNVAEQCLSTDILLLYLPSQIAWACWMVACKRHALGEDWEACVRPIASLRSLLKSFLI